MDITGVVFLTFLYIIIVNHIVLRGNGFEHQRIRKKEK